MYIVDRVEKDRNDRDKITIKITDVSRIYNITNFIMLQCDECHIVINVTK